MGNEFAIIALASACPPHKWAINYAIIAVGFSLFIPINGQSILLSLPFGFSQRIKGYQ
jgi:hypothetical protein